MVYHEFIPQFWWNECNPHIITNYKPMRNEIVIKQIISLHKPNKKLRSEKIMMHLVPQIKHSILSSPFGLLYKHTTRSKPTRSRQTHTARTHRQPWRSGAMPTAAAAAAGCGSASAGARAPRRTSSRRSRSRAGRRTGGRCAARGPGWRTASRRGRWSRRSCTRCAPAAAPT
jgi:hypothetical protein